MSLLMATLILLYCKCQCQWYFQYHDDLSVCPGHCECQCKCRTTFIFIASVSVSGIFSTIIEHSSDLGQWRIQRGHRGPALPPPPPPPPSFLDFFFLFFLQKRSLLAKISIKRVRNLSQNAGIGHLETQIFKTFRGACPPTP